MPLFSVLARCASSVSNSALALHLNILTYKLCIEGEKKYMKIVWLNL